MNITGFLEQLQNISLEENEKENQVLSQKENVKRSSKLCGSKIPFAQLEKFSKSSKKITFLLKQRESESQKGEMEDSLGQQLMPEKPILSKKVSKVSTNPTLTFLKSYEEKDQKSKLVFPKNFEERIKILKTLR